MPSIQDKSSIIPDESFDIVWEWLPSYYRINDPSLVYSTKKNGYLLKTLYDYCNKVLNEEMILIIRTTEKSVRN